MGKVCRKITKATWKKQTASKHTLINSMMVPQFEKIFYYFFCLEVNLRIIFFFFSGVDDPAVGDQTMYNGQESSIWIQRESLHFDDDLQWILTLNLPQRFHVSTKYFDQWIKERTYAWWLTQVHSKINLKFNFQYIDSIDTLIVWCIKGKTGASAFSLGVFYILLHVPGFSCSTPPTRTSSTSSSSATASSPSQYSCASSSPARWYSD